MACTSRTYIRTLDLATDRFACDSVTGKLTIQEKGDFTLNAITVVGGVVTISGAHTNSVDGTVDNFTQQFTIPAETVTSISGDAGAGTITYVDENGASTVIDVCSIIATCDQGDFTFNPATNVLTHTSSDGTVSNITLPVTSLSINPTTNEISFVDELGATTLINLDEKGDLTYNALTQEITHYNSISGSTQTIQLSLADGFLDSVTYNDTTKDLVFSWNTDAGLADTTINLGDLIDVYSVTGSTCISVTGTGTAGDPWVIAPVVSPDADNILECSANGLKVDYCAPFDELIAAFPNLDCGPLPSI